MVEWILLICHRVLGFALIPHPRKRGFVSIQDEGDDDKDEDDDVDPQPEKEVNRATRRITIEVKV
jgi:hypothetical protein